MLGIKTTKIHLILDKHIFLIRYVSGEKIKLDPMQLTVTELTGF